MAEFPGELTRAEQAEWVARFRRMAADRWGSDRAGDIGEALDATALAVGAVLKLEFAKDEAPGFYLPVNFDPVAVEWKVE